MPVSIFLAEGDRDIQGFCLSFLAQGLGFLSQHPILRIGVLVELVIVNMVTFDPFVVLMIMQYCPRVGILTRYRYPDVDFDHTLLPLLEILIITRTKMSKSPPILHHTPPTPPDKILPYTIPLPPPFLLPLYRQSCTDTC